MSTEFTIDTAVVLAAGNGRRMADHSNRPKPLIEVGGRPLLGHVLDRLRETPISRVVIVTGYRAAEIREVFSDENGSLSIEWVHNADYHQANGVSLLRCEQVIDRPFALLMSDHLFEVRALNKVLATSLPVSGGILATDQKIDQVFDLEDATKVRSDRHLVREVGKELPNFDCVDTGMFALTTGVFDALRNSIERGDSSLSAGISTLAAKDAVHRCDIGDCRWIDVDTQAAAEEAEAMIQSEAFTE